MANAGDYEQMSAGEEDDDVLTWAPEEHGSEAGLNDSRLVTLDAQEHLVVKTYSGTSDLQASVSLFKCVIGAGSFLFPFAFSRAGIVAAVVGVVFFGWLSAYTIRLLAAAERQWRSSHPSRRNEELTIVSLAQRVLSSATVTDGVTADIDGVCDGVCDGVATECDGDGNSINTVAICDSSDDELTEELLPASDRSDRKGSFLGAMVYLGAVATIVGVCGVYVDFIGESMTRISKDMSFLPDVPQWAWHLAVMPPLILMSWLRDMRQLAVTSLFGDVVVVLGFVGCVVNGAVYSADTHTAPWELPLVRPDTLFQFFGQTVFLFAVHVASLPVAQSMRHPTHFDGVANRSFSVITLVSTAFAMSCWCLFGDDIEQSVLESLVGVKFRSIVKLVICVDLFFTVPILMCAPRELLEDSLLGRRGTDEARRRRGLWTENLVRAGFVVAFVMLSLLVPDLGDLATLVGSMVSPLVGFVLPIALWWKLRSRSASSLSKSAHVAIAVFGAVSMLFCTGMQVRKMVSS